MESVTARIIAMNNEFIQAAALKAELFDSQFDHGAHPSYDKAFVKKAVNWNLYMNNISKLSYLFDSSINFKRFYAEKSFVLLDWLIIEKIFQDPKFFQNEFSQIPVLQQLRICYNILPNQSSLMHRLAMNTQMSGSDDIALKLFNICKTQDIKGISN